MAERQSVADPAAQRRELAEANHVVVDQGILDGENEKRTPSGVGSALTSFRRTCAPFFLSAPVAS